MDIKIKYLTTIFILVLIIGVVIINTPKDNKEKHNTENFNDIEGISIDNLDNIENIYFNHKTEDYHLTDITNLDDYLKEKIDTLFNIQKLIDDYKPTEVKLIDDNKPTEVKLIDYLPKGTILMWNGTILPEGWLWCDGENETPDLRYFMPLGGKNNLEGNNKDKINEGIIKKEHLFNLFDEEQITKDGEQITKDREQILKIKKEFIPEHTHKFANFPNIDHGHGQTESSGNHTHNYKKLMPYGINHPTDNRLFTGWHGCAGWEDGEFPKDIGSKSSHAGNHSHTTNKKLDTIANEIRNTETSVENIYTTENPDKNYQDEYEASKYKKFYPKCTLINFIIKV